MRNYATDQCFDHTNHRSELNHCRSMVCGGILHGILCYSCPEVSSQPSNHCFHFNLNPLQLASITSQKMASIGSNYDSDDSE